jgi:hypothetical protein
MVIGEMGQMDKKSETRQVLRMGLEAKWLSEAREVAPVAIACINGDGMLRAENIVSYYCNLGMKDLDCPYLNNLYQIHSRGQSFPHCMYQREEDK